jgi:hypothetical protein
MPCGRLSGLTARPRSNGLDIGLRWMSFAEIPDQILSI